MTAETEDVAIVEAPLSTDERRDKERHEDTIRRGQQTFIEVGLALADINRRRLYRETHPSFEVYLGERFPEISRRRAYQLIDGAETAQLLADVNPGTQPEITSERQVRPLAGLPPEQKAEVWRQATDAAGGRAPTPAQVETAARAVKPPRPAPAPPSAVSLPPSPAPAASPPAPTPMQALTPLPAAAPAPLPGLTPLAPAEEVAAAAPDRTALRQAEALIALLDQALSLAQSERDRVIRELGAGHGEVTFPDAAVELAARTFVASPAVKGAAAFLAMSAQEAA